MIYFLLALVIVVLDQWLKFWVLENIPLYESIPCLPGLLELTYIQNTGAAFSMMSESTGLLACISVGMSVFLGYLLYSNYFPHVFGKISLAMVLGGAVGNLIDRVFRGFVVDMFDLLFVRFAIFNIADIFVVVGGIMAAGYYVFCMDKEGEEPGTDSEAETPLGAEQSEDSTEEGEHP